MRGPPSLGQSCSGGDDRRWTGADVLPQDHVLGFNLEITTYPGPQDALLPKPSILQVLKVEAVGDSDLKPLVSSRLPCHVNSTSSDFRGNLLKMPDEYLRYGDKVVRRQVLRFQVYLKRGP